MRCVSGSTMFLSRFYDLWPPTPPPGIPTFPEESMLMIPLPVLLQAYWHLMCLWTTSSWAGCFLYAGAQMDPGGSGCRLEGVLECIQASTQQDANYQWTTAPDYHPGLSIWLSTKNILLFTVSRNPSWFIGPFTNKDIIRPATVTLTLPEDVATSNLCPPAKSPRLINSDPVYPVHGLIGVRPTIPAVYERLWPCGAFMSALCFQFGPRCNPGLSQDPTSLSSCL